MSGRVTDRWGREQRAARRDAYWNRTKAPRDWRYWVGGLGRVLIVTGLLMFGFVAYQLWGTGLEYTQAQDRLDTELEDLFANAGAQSATTTADANTTTTTTASTASTDTTTTVPGETAPSTSAAEPTTSTTSTTSTIPVPVIEEGAGFAFLEMPTIDVDAVIVAGVRPADLKTGPGHYPGTPMPGQLGNSAIACHRTTYGQPCFRLDELAVGDEIVITSVQGRFVYLVTGSEVVSPDRGDVVLTTDPTVAQLTLTTCDPKYTATNRLIVRAMLDPTAGTAAQPAVLEYGPGLPMEPDDGTDGAVAAPAVTTPATLPGSVDATPDSIPAPATPSQVEDAFAQGWFHDTDAWPQIGAWAAAAAGVAVLSYAVARTLRRRWLGWAVAIVPFVVTLYFFYQNVNRLLPAAL